MASTLIGLADLERLVISRMRNEFTKKSDFLTRPHMDLHLGQAYVEIQRHAKPYKRRDRQGTVADQIEYDLPADILDRMVIAGGVQIDIDGDGRRIAHPKLKTWDFATDIYGDFSNPNSRNGPNHWAFSNIDQRQLLLLWPPENTVASTGLTIYYVPDPGNLSRVYEQDTITATFTNADATVLFSAAATTNFQAGDLIGRRAASADLPTIWYRIASITDSTNIELGEPGGAEDTYDEVTAAGSLFTVQQVSPVEANRRGLVRYAPANYALWKIAETDRGPGAGATFLAEWQRDLTQIKDDGMVQAGQTFRRRDGRRRNPNMARKTAA